MTRRPCQCVDCFGDKPAHDPDCVYMHNLHLPEEKDFNAPGKWFPVDIFGNPMREYKPGQWETAKWPSES